MTVILHLLTESNNRYTAKPPPPTTSNHSYVYTITRIEHSRTPVGERTRRDHGGCPGDT